MDEDDYVLYEVRTWKAKRNKNGRRSCYNTEKTKISAFEYQLNELIAIDRMISVVKFNFDEKMRRIREYRQFYESIVIYNNSVSFVSEGIDNVDYAITPFIFRM